MKVTVCVLAFGNECLARYTIWPLIVAGVRSNEAHIL